MVYCVPMIDGQNPGYIVKALRSLQVRRAHAPEDEGIAATLSDEDMADLAFYSAPREPKRPVRRIPLLAVAAAFASSAAAQQTGKSRRRAPPDLRHLSRRGRQQPLPPEFPKLAGQHADYLVQTMNAYKSGKRKNPIMAGQANDQTAKRWRRSPRTTPPAGHAQDRPAAPGRQGRPLPAGGSPAAALQVGVPSGTACVRCAGQTISPRHSSTPCSASCRRPGRRDPSNSARIPGGWSIASWSSIARCRPMCRNGFDWPPSGV